MNTEKRRFVTVLSTLCLLASCAQTGALERQNGNMNKIAQSSSTFADHDSIVKGYENTAKEMAWHQKLLQVIIPLERCTVRSENGSIKS